MNPIPCRDCGNMIDPSSRGCSTCAMNLDAERMIDKFIVCGFVVAAIAAIVIIAFLFFRH